MKAAKKALVTRFSISLPPELARQLDRMCREKGYNNRSLAVADMIRDQLVDHQQQQLGDREIVGTITLVYDHNKRGLQEDLTSFQHDHYQAIISTLHVHLDPHNCLEVLVVRGPAEEIRRLADRLIGAKGVKHGELTITTTGKGLPG